MNVVNQPEVLVSRLAATIGEPARVRMLFCLVDGRARTSTELAVIAEVSPSTASAHLKRLVSEKLVSVSAQGKHRYFSLQGTAVASALESLSVLAGEANHKFVPSTPNRLRFARTCYDHIAGHLGVSVHERLLELGWLSTDSGDNNYELTRLGPQQLRPWASTSQRRANCDVALRTCASTGASDVLISEEHLVPHY